MITATRYHEIDAGHRVVGQGGKCEHLHGHRYRNCYALESWL
jgi:6-pyruvoyl-tetrahydropterin synthase